MSPRLAIHLAAASLSAVILAPLAAPGYVLSYDMNFVPRQWHTLDLIAPVDGAPRAVPIDAVISTLNVLVPGCLLQRVILVAIIWAGVVGAARLVPSSRTAIKILAGVVYVWSPFLAERLLFGHWALLLAYAALPWLISATWEARQGRRQALPKVLLAAGICCLTPTGGVIAFSVCLVMLIGLPWRPLSTVLIGLLVLNSPWLVAAAVTRSDMRTSPFGITAFSPRSENWAGPVISLLGTGGIWNGEATPASRASALIPLATVVLLTVAWAGYRLLADRQPDARRLLIVGAAGLFAAILSTIPAAQPGLSWLVEHAPGAGIVRDSQKFLMPFALLLATCFALGIERLAGRLSREAGAALVAAGLLLPVVAMPDLAFGGAGALRPVTYPADWKTIAELVRADPGRMLSLPLAEYRSYPWNRGRTVLDPSPRFFPVPVLVDDTLRVDGQVIAGESREARQIKALVGNGEPLSETSFRWIMIQGPADSVSPASLAGLEPVHSGQDLSLYRNPSPTAPDHDTSRQLAIIVAMCCASLLYVGTGTYFWRTR